MKADNEQVHNYCRMSGNERTMLSFDAAVIFYNEHIKLPNYLAVRKLVSAEQRGMIFISALTEGFCLYLYWSALFLSHTQTKESVQ